MTPIEKVIDNGFCIGCGACRAISADFKLGPTASGAIEVLDRPSSTEILSLASAACPFGAAPDEDTFSRSLFPGQPYDDGVGAYAALYAGYSSAYRRVGGSGGLTRWLLARLLREGEIEFVISVDRKVESEGSGEPLFYYTIHDNRETYLNHTSTSAYYPVSLEYVLRAAAERGGRFAVTALPCFARALRALTLNDPELAQRIVVISGTICGSLKSRRYADYLSAQMGLPPNRLGRINFRGKGQSRKANEKTVEVWSITNDSEAPDESKRVQDLKGTDYGVGYFKPKACDYCDDVFAETADVSFGDAWIRPYDQRPEGTNVVVVRQPWLRSLFEQAVDEGEIILDPLSIQQVRETQLSGLRHRREGLAVRLWFARAFRQWTPPKRIKPSLGSPSFMLTQLLRVLVRRISSASSISVTGRTLPLIMRPITILHRRLRPWSTADKMRAQRRLPTAG